MADTCNFITNPETIGLGVRISVYTQAILAMIPPLLSVIDTTVVRKDPSSLYYKLSAPEPSVHRLRKTSLTCIFTGSALLISTFVQAFISGLNVYEGIIVLSLSWINNLTAALSFYYVLHLRDFNHLDRIRTYGPIAAELFAYLTHFCVTAALGLWLWARVNELPCADLTFYWVLGHHVSTNTHWFRVVWLVVYSLAAIPFVNWLLLLTLAFIFMCPYHMLCEPWRYQFRPALSARFPNLFPPVRWLVGDEQTKTRWKDLLCVALWVAMNMNVLLISATEMTIKINRGDGAHPEAAWTFGQTLAILILFFPLFEVGQGLKDSVALRPLWAKLARLFIPGLSQASLGQPSSIVDSASVKTAVGDPDVEKVGKGDSSVLTTSTDTMV